MFGARKYNSGLRFEAVSSGSSGILKPGQRQGYISGSNNRLLLAATKSRYIKQGSRSVDALKTYASSMRSIWLAMRNTVGQSLSLNKVFASSGAVENAVEFEILPGKSYPLGPSEASMENSTKEIVSGVNFAVASNNAKNISLVLYKEDGSEIARLDLFKDGQEGIWHGFVPNLAKRRVLYGIIVSGDGGWETPFRWDSSRVLLDPYAPYVAGRAKFGVRDEFEKFEPVMGSRFFGTYDFEQSEFDWGDDYSRPSIPFQDLVILELAVRSFTASPSSGLTKDKLGTFAGLEAKVDHLVELGVNAVELLPVFEYDELEFQRHKNPRDHMTNIWGYSHLSFVAPMSRFGTQTGSHGGSDPVATAREFKSMVKTLHKNGIEVILDVVYNHTAEADDADPYLLSWRGIDALEYYQQTPGGHPALVNFSGCGNTFNVNGRRGKDLVIHSLRRWVEEFHVDGFRFDLASCLCRDAQGHAMADPPLVRQICEDPVLSKVKLIAEPWDLGMYQVGSFPAHGQWAEWNGKYRDDVRKFIKGDPGMKSAFATRLSGSQDLYASSGRKPYHSVNFVIAHDGFTLADLVSYNDKHNEANGENNMDGTNDNFSWNCGKEGPAHGDTVIEAIRTRQMKNYHVALMFSQGTPMILSGDEYGQTRWGNNNWYGHDSEMTQFDWVALEKSKENGWFNFYKSVINMRRQCPLLGRPDFLSGQDVTWHEDNWDDPESRFLAFTLHDRHQEYLGDIYVAFNTHPFQVQVHLPDPGQGRKWCRIIDTNLPPPRDFVEGGNDGVEQSYEIQAHSSIVLVSKQA